MPNIMYHFTTVEKLYEMLDNNFNISLPSLTVYNDDELSRNLFSNILEYKYNIRLALDVDLLKIKYKYSEFNFNFKNNLNKIQDYNNTTNLININLKDSIKEIFIFLISIEIYNNKIYNVNNIEVNKNKNWMPYKDFYCNDIYNIKGIKFEL